MAYFLQVNLCWLMFYGLYYVLLSKETFFKLNRIYLIISLLCGLAIPFFTERLSQMEEVSTLPIMEIAQPIAQSISIFQENIETEMPLTETSWNLWLILKGLYILGALWFLTQFVVGLFRIFKLYKNGVKEKKQGFTIINSNGVKVPFSFFNLIFINSKISQNVDFQHIMLHERAHVQQKHSFDIVGTEILRGLFWLSPLVHLYARSLRHVHEYLADSAVLQNTEKKQYGRLLINQTAAGSGLVLANHLNFSQLKKRIIMMTRNRSQRVALVKYTLAAPVFVLLILAFTIHNSSFKKNTEGVAENIENTINSIESNIKNKTQSVDYQSNTNDCLPESIVNLECETGGFWIAERFKKQEFLNVKKGYTLQSFKLVKSNSKGEILATVSNEGDKFNEEVLKLIKRAVVGDRFSFLDIKIIEPYDKDEYVWGSINIHISDKVFPRQLILQYGLFKDNNESVIRNGLYFKTFKDLRRVFVLDGYEIIKPIRFTKWTSDWVIGSDKGIIKYEGKTNSPYFDKDALAILENTKVGESYSFHWEMKQKGGDSTIVGTYFLKAVDVTINKYPFTILSNGKSSGDITLKELKKAEYAIAKVTEKGETRTLKILKFSVLLRPSFYSKKEVKEVINEGANFSEDLKKLLISAEEGDEIIFNNLQVFDGVKNSNVGAVGLLFNVKSK